MRTAMIEIAGICASPPEPLQLVVNVQKTLAGDNLSLKQLPEVIGAWSEGFGRHEPHAGNMIERRFVTETGYAQAIYEEIGESIARHIW